MEGMFELILIPALVLLAVYIFSLKRKYDQLKRSTPAGVAIKEIAFEKTALGMAVVLPDFTYVDINPSYCNIVGYSKDELMEMTHKDFIHPEDQDNDTSYARELLLGKSDSFQSIKRYIHKAGYIVWAKATVSIVRDELQNPKFFVTQIQDITLTKNAEEALKKAKVRAETLASTDYLTGCLNRRVFMNRLGEELARGKRSQTKVSLILVDIDNFKSINDFYGHLAGDYVLQQFSECLSQETRTYDFICRFGGEEFIICLPDTEIQDAYLIAERMRQSVEEMMTVYEGSLIKITGSFGVVGSRLESDEPTDRLIARADQAMYKAKSVRNRVYKSA